MNITSTILTPLVNFTVANTSTTPTTSAASTTTLGPVGFTGLKFRDGLREPPLFTESNNLIIIILGMSILILPVIGFLVCMCAKSRVLKNLRGMKLTSEEATGGLPYSHFDSEPDDEYGGSRKRRENAGSNLKPDVSLIINNDNTVIGSPRRGEGQTMLGKTLKTTTIKSSTGGSEHYKGAGSTSSASDEYATLDVDATFVLPREKDASWYS